MSLTLDLALMSESKLQLYSSPNHGKDLSPKFYNRHIPLTCNHAKLTQRGTTDRTARKTTE